MLRTGSIILGLLLCLGGARGFEPMYERAPIHYHESTPDTRVTRLFAEAKPGGVLATGSDRDILEALLKELDIPIESQVMVFSKTSAQNSRISPETPRVIYFNDNAYIGWVQGGEMEVASFDEKLGMVFHLIRLTEREPNQPPPLHRERSCLNCHAGSSNRNFPGVMVRSVYAQATGQPIFQAGTFHTRQDSPIEERWGGWYVTGSVEDREHLGNCIATAAGRDGEVTMERARKGPVEVLDGFFDTEPYLRNTSDIVALMTLEHQVGTHNMLVEANITTRATLHRHREMQKAFGESPDSPLSETNQRILDHLADDVLREMLYVEEVPLPGGIEGGMDFQIAFEERGTKSEEGRSLRDFRLYERLMKYRCSHLIYSDSFAHLPDAIRSRILVKLHGILTEPGSYPDYAHLGDSERERIHAILLETLPDLPPVWRKKDS